VMCDEMSGFAKPPVGFYQQITECNSSRAKNKGFFAGLLRRRKGRSGYAEKN